ncbi:helix-turn-helix transcriptional regulator [Actinoplanes sp. NPDC051494]|uniref:helix-turn-helix transcriptional regulator n=1 Tax=Actinoplanes sp. NPDC051494 TaxID=3363907 RepID=UPI0037AA9760
MSSFGDFLRAQRDRDVRRDEVAALAGVSADHYARLEQGREPPPPAQMIDAICRALRLGPDERRRAYRIACRGQEVGPELLRLMNAFPHAAAYVVNPALRVLAANPTAEALIGPRQLASQPVPFLFLDPEARRYFVDWEIVARAAVSALRIAAGQRPVHPEVSGLVGRLVRESAAFAMLWDDRAVTGRSATYKTIDHPEVGRLELAHQTLDVRDAPGQQLIVATAPLGSPSGDALTLLSLTAD